MQDRLRSYSIISSACFACAVVATLFIWFSVPVYGHPWPSAVWFVLFATLAGMLAVGVNEGNRTLVTPTSPAYWTATCVLGPAVSSIVCVISAILGHGITCVAFYWARSLGLLDAQGMLAAPKPRVGRGRQRTAFVESFNASLARIGANWYMRDLDSVIRAVMLHVATLALSAGLSGVTYLLLGGHFLIDLASGFSLLRNFILPFAGLVCVSIAVEHGIYVLVVSAIDPVPGAKRGYAILLRARMALIDDVLPVWRGELFLAIVALLLSYLYVSIGIWGLVLAVMPVLALRDFFYQWVQTKAAYLDTITTLATYMQYYHPYTRGHLKRVADISERLSRELRLPVESIMHMRSAGFLHDIGKIGVSEEILDKTEKLTDDEWGTIKEHPVKGAEIIAHLEFLEGIVDWVKYHHKWHNGSGYPATNGNGAHIPIEAEIIAVADAFDAMTDDRELTLDWKCDSCGYVPENGERPDICPVCEAKKSRVYRKPKSLDDAIEELRRGAGSQFNPVVVKAFLGMVAREGIHYDA